MVKILIVKVLKILHDKIKNYQIRYFIERIIILIDGGEFFSKNLREIYKKNYNMEIGIGSYGCFHRGFFYTEVGKYTSIAKGAYRFYRNHPKNYVSTHPIFFNKELNCLEKDKVKAEKLKIGNDVWIGMNVLIGAKVKIIADGVIIGSGSIVLKDIVEPYSIYAGNPAKKIGERFNEEKIQKIQSSKWWDLPLEEIREFIRRNQYKTADFMEICYLKGEINEEKTNNND